MDLYAIWVPAQLKSARTRGLTSVYWGASHRWWQADQVVRRATAGEQPAHFFQASQLDLTRRAGVLEPSEALLDQLSPAQADGTARQSCGSSGQNVASEVVPKPDSRSDAGLLESQ